MIDSKEMTIEEVFKNKDLILAQKKNAIKHADIVLNVLKSEQKDATEKAGVDLTVENPSVLNAKLVINTTNLIDSHMDCHINGIWNKSINDKPQIFLLQEHEMEFDKIIADSAIDKLDFYVEKKTFKQLGYNYQGNTEALIFDVQIKKEVNEYMFDLYRKGRVTQHSVGMRYVKIFLCINSDEANYSSEKANWDKYYHVVANKEVADNKGFFWAVTEAKVIEGSAVVKASNECTPVMEIEIEKQDIHEPSNDTQENEPTKVTQKRRRLV